MAARRGAIRVRSWTGPHHWKPCAGGQCDTEGSMRGAPWYRWRRGGGTKACQRLRNSRGARASAACSRVPGLGGEQATRSPAHAKRCVLGARQGHSLALAFECLPVAGLDADTGVQGEACPELVSPPWSHWRISAAASGVMSPSRAKSPHFQYDTSLFSREFAPSCTARTRVAVPPPVIQGQRLSVSLFSCGILRAYGGSWGFLRTSGIRAACPVRAGFRSCRNCRDEIHRAGNNNKRPLGRAILSN